MKTEFTKREHMWKHIRESPPQIENPIMARVYVRSIMCNTIYQNNPFYRQKWGSEN